MKADILVLYPTIMNRGNNISTTMEGDNKKLGKL